jgi:hypothetical protein
MKKMNTLTEQMINITNELSDAQKKSLKMEIMDDITEKLMEKLKDTINQKVQDALRKYQDITIKNLRIHRNN